MGREWQSRGWDRIGCGEEQEQEQGEGLMMKGAGRADESRHGTGGGWAGSAGSPKAAGKGIKSCSTH